MLCHIYMHFHLYLHRKHSDGPGPSLPAANRWICSHFSWVQLQDCALLKANWSASCQLAAHSFIPSFIHWIIFTLKCPMRVEVDWVHLQTYIGHRGWYAEARPNKLNTWYFMRRKVKSQFRYFPGFFTHVGWVCIIQHFVSSLVRNERKWPRSTRRRTSWSSKFLSWTDFPFKFGWFYNERELDKLNFTSPKYIEGC